MRNDVYLFDLNDTEVLLCDGLQLITARAYRLPNRKPKYRTYAFNRHGRHGFLQDTERRGIELTPEARSLVEAVVPDWEDIRRRGEKEAYADMYAKLEAIRKEKAKGGTVSA